MKSVIQKEKCCWFCGSQEYLENHHIFGGPNRKKSEKYGLKVWLCHFCHRDNRAGVHADPEKQAELHRQGQQEFEKKYTRERFVQEFGKNYLDEPSDRPPGLCNVREKSEKPEENGFQWI